MSQTQPSQAPSSTTEMPVAGAFLAHLKNLGYGLVCLVAGLALLGWQWVSRSGAMATLQWPVVEGKVVSSEVQERDVYRRKRIRHIYDPQIAYTYQVSGRDYTGRAAHCLNLSWSCCVVWMSGPNGVPFAVG
jgi:hypothetical protein